MKLSITEYGGANWSVDSWRQLRLSNILSTGKGATSTDMDPWTERGSTKKQMIVCITSETLIFCGQITQHSASFYKLNKQEI